ncbi:hypothetical protein B0H67DRAFT_146626 [Lasiosphaeris hirsuta]|uniref:Uncharacterized protein n=1 Tax=Lasiosphaeris hirsuta TaxID=260670 RepID=A0AA40B1W9_9PEZI|nr:hypothetical protein B0H67DRAFT_146626 [Lasiosphaeris hirsuta]
MSPPYHGSRGSCREDCPRYEHPATPFFQQQQDFPNLASNTFASKFFFFFGRRASCARSGLGLSDGAVMFAKCPLYLRPALPTRACASSIVVTLPPPFHSPRDRALPAATQDRAGYVHRHLGPAHHQDAGRQEVGPLQPPAAVPRRRHHRQRRPPPPDAVLGPVADVPQASVPVLYGAMVKHHVEVVDAEAVQMLRDFLSSSLRAT